MLVSMIRVGYQTGLSLRTVSTRSDCVKTTRQSLRLSMFSIQARYSAWLCLDEILKSGVNIW